MPAIASAQTLALYLFDVAEEIDLARVAQDITARASRPQPALRPAMPAHLKYERPPLLVEGDALDAPTIHGFRARWKLYDYGVVSLALSRPFQGTWPELLDLALELHDNAALEAEAERQCRALLDCVSRALVSPRTDLLTEDYLVFGLSAFDPPLTSRQLVDRYGHEIARLLRGERETLSVQERDEVLRHRMSYLETDLFVPAWSAALVCDTEPGVLGAVEIVEYANSQLLELRYYDDLLDHELETLYDLLEASRQPWSWFARRRYLHAARRVQSLVIEVNELTDKTENALKMVGDVYAARLHGLIAARLGLDHWKRNVEEKLAHLDEIYRFSVDQVQIARGHLLELTIVLILVLELVLFFMGIMQ